MLNSGQVILRYRIVEVLGRGETGIVYTADDVETGERVAIKTFDWPADSGGQVAARLRKEATAAQALRHPHICAIRAIEQVGDLVCIVMDLLEGTPLDVVIGGEPLPVPSIVAYALDIASAVGAAHRRAILHHDLKPSKIIVGPAGLKVLDFGIGWILKQAQGDMTTAAAALGFALSYASPELIRAEPKDARSDLFSLGCILYEMATGTPPFRAGDPGAVMRAILNEAPAPPSDLNLEIPTALEAIILKALEKNREARYQGADALIADLERVPRERADSREASDGGQPPPGNGQRGASRLRMPATIGPYEIQEQIAVGGMGAVYLARDPRLDRQVVVKIAREDLDEPVLQDLLRGEVEAARVLHHRNIVRVFEAGEIDGRPFIAMEHVRGETLLELIRSRAALSLDRKLDLMDQLCAGLEHAHRHGIVHRDIAPANIMVDDRGVLKILDFGVAQAGAPRLPEGTIVGKAGYLAPEQARGLPVDVRADVFSAGAVFYELLTYRRAFAGDSQIEILQKVLAAGPDPLPSVVPGLDPELVRVIEHCLAKEPERRIADISSVRESLARIRRRLTSDDVAAETIVLPASPRPRQSAAAPLQRAPRDYPTAVSLQAPPTPPSASSPTARAGRRAASAPEYLPRQLDLAVPPRVPALEPMELIALIRQPESRSLQALLESEVETSAMQTRTRGFGMEFLRDATGGLLPAAVTMRVVAPDFDPPLIEKKVRVLPDRDCGRQSFLLTPQHVGSLSIQFDVLLGDVTLASRSLQTVSEPGGRLATADPPVLVSVPLRVNVDPRPWWRPTATAVGMLGTAAAVLLAAVIALVGLPDSCRDSTGADADAPARATDAQSPGLRGASPATTVPPVTPLPVAADGPAHALVIGINEYAHLPSLTTAVNDAVAVEEMLRERYGFVTRLLRNGEATRYGLLSALNTYRGSLPANASLLIYYAGHGEYDKAADKAYWLPADAQPDNPANWIIADDVTSTIRAVPANHVLVVADSCYSGGLTRGFEPRIRLEARDRYLARMSAGTSRTLLASGGNEPVADGGGDGSHSVFATAFLRGLDAMEPDRFTAHELFGQFISVPVAGRSEQTPQYVPIRNSGHDNGDFVFTRRR